MANEQTTALVTGATGFLGSSLVRRLAEEGRSVHVIGRGGSKLDLLAPVRDRITIHIHNGTTEGLSEIVAAAAPDVVYHLASLFLATHKPADVSPLIQSNVLFAGQLAEAMMLNGCHRLVNTGTAWQHFENRPYGPTCLYAATKQAAEDIFQYYVESTPLRTITLKIFDSYGPADPRPKLFSALRRAATMRQSLDFVPPDQKLNLVYIDDLMDAFVSAGGRLMDGVVKDQERYSLPAQRPVSLKELVEIVSRNVGFDLPIKWGVRAYRAKEILDPPTCVPGLAGWSAKVSIEEGVRRVVESWQLEHKAT